MVTMKNSEKICAPLLGAICSEEYVAPSVRVRVLDKGRVLCQSDQLKMYSGESWDDQINSYSGTQW